MGSNPIGPAFAPTSRTPNCSREKRLCEVIRLRAPELTRFGIILTGGPYQTERWETACRIADAALDRSDQVTFFLFMDGVYNALATERFAAMEKLPKDLGCTWTW